MSIRLERVAKLVQRDVADILANELAHEVDGFVTVTGVRMTKDLSIAYVYVSFMGGTDAARQAAFRHLVTLAPAVRGALSARMRNQLRSMPDVKFFLDQSLEKSQHMEDIFQRIRQERDGREEAHPSDGDGATPGEPPLGDEREDG